MSVLAQQVDVLCSESRRTFLRRARMWTVTVFRRPMPFLEILTGKWSLKMIRWGRSPSLWYVSGSCRSVEMKYVALGFLRPGTRYWCCVQYVSDKFLPANWKKGHGLKMIFDSCWKIPDLSYLQKRSADALDSSIFFCLFTCRPHVSHWFTTLIQNTHF